MKRRHLALGATLTVLAIAAHTYYTFDDRIHDETLRLYESELCINYWGEPTSLSIKPMIQGDNALYYCQGENGRVEVMVVGGEYFCYREVKRGSTFYPGSLEGCI